MDDYHNAVVPVAIRAHGDRDEVVASSLNRSGVTRGLTGRFRAAHTHFGASTGRWIASDTRSRVPEGYGQGRKRRRH